MQNNRNKIRLFTDSVGRSMDINALQSFLLQMDSSETLRINGCRSVEKYDEEEILLQCFYGLICISGSALRMPLYSQNETVVCGMIKEIRFEWEEHREHDKKTV